MLADLDYLGAKNGFFHQLLDFAFGISGLETAFPLLYTELVKKDLITLPELVRRMSPNPAMIIGLKTKGQLKIGFDADLTIIDLKKTEIVAKEKLLSKGKNTPFHGREVEGIPVMTIVNGQIVYKNTSEKAP